MLTAPFPDVDPAMPGDQTDCIVEDVVGDAVRLVPPCDAVGTPTCWRLESDPALCTTLDHQKLVVVRSGSPEPSTITRMRCAVAP